MSKRQHDVLKRYLIRPYRNVFFFFLTMILFGFGLHEARKSLVVLPGTEPGTVAAADNVLTCKQCHHSTAVNRPVTIYDQWAGSMMAHSAQDPIFYAALAVANKYNSVTGQAHGEFCIRCHSPNGWLAGHSEDYTGQSLTGTDFDGVQCDYCHRSVNPLNPDSTVPPLTSPVPGYGNGMHVFQRYSTPKRGPFDSVVAPHATRFDAFQQSSELCGVCHDVSNPFYAQDPTNQAPHEYSPLERTYSEWLVSWYATQGDSGTCQSCHMADTSAYDCVYLSAPLRAHLAKHDLTGGNTFVPDILPDFSGFFNSSTYIDTAALQAGKQRAVTTLQRAADLSVDAHRTGDTVFSNVRITNLTGHKLPTGYPDGRRMWINVIGRNAQGDTVFQSGSYNTDSALLVRDNQLKVYEAIQGLTASRAASYGLPAGPSLHFILNDTVLFDNRIPPKGFDNLAFHLRFADPVGAVYADSQYWDIARYKLPGVATQAVVNLWYQTISKEYIEFLQSENVGNFYDWNSWGDKLFTSWQMHGKSQPVLMNSVTIPVQATAVNDDENAIPGAFVLMQNYPNPFNPRTTFGFRISDFGFVTLKVFDIFGREVAKLVNEKKTPGTYKITFDASNFASGMYFYTLSVNGRSSTKKMLFIR